MSAQPESASAVATARAPSDAGDEGAPLTPWRARALRRATRSDLAYAAVALALAALALWSGNAAARHVSPDGARSVSQLLDELELPRTLPNATLARDDGTGARLWDLTTSGRTIVTFYAPWCGPCQEELPQLVAGTASHADRLAVVVGSDEDLADVRKQLDNLGFKDLRFYVDGKRELEAGARVTALPTTLLVGRMGRVRERIVGYSAFRVQMLIFRATHDEASPFDNVG